MSQTGSGAGPYSPFSLSGEDADQAGGVAGQGAGAGEHGAEGLLALAAPAGGVPQLPGTAARLVRAPALGCRLAVPGRSVRCVPAMPAAHPQWEDHCVAQHHSHHRSTPPAHVDRVYRGHWAPGGGLVTIEDPDGTVTGVLTHVVRHSPSGLAWGCSGSGPADLARSLLIDALDDQARCPRCAGSGVWDAALGVDLNLEALSDGARNELIVDCPDCDHGWNPVIGRIYQRLKIAVISTLPPEGDWTLARGDILAFVADQAPRRALTARAPSAPGEKTMPSPPAPGPGGPPLVGAGRLLPERAAGRQMPSARGPVRRATRRAGGRAA